MKKIIKTLLILLAILIGIFSDKYTMPINSNLDYSAYADIFFPSLLFLIIIGPMLAIYFLRKEKDKKVNLYINIITSVFTVYILSVLIYQSYIYFDLMSSLFYLVIIILLTSSIFFNKLFRTI